MRTSRREFIVAGSVSMIGLSGCSALQDDDPGGQNQPEDDDTPIPERECTEAYVSDFNWDSNLFSEDEFQITIINEGDVAGNVEVTLSFWQSESKDVREGTITRRVSIGGQATEDETLSANAPTDESEYASVSVTEQDCQ